MTLKCRILKFVESFTLCEMDEVDFVLVDIFLTHGRCEAQANAPCVVP